METKKIIDKHNITDMKNEVINLKGLVTINMDFINTSEMAISQLEKNILEIDKKIEKLRIEIVNAAEDKFNFLLDNKEKTEDYYFEEMNEAIREYESYSKRRVLFINKAKLMQLENIKRSRVAQYNIFIVNKEQFIKENKEKIKLFNVAVSKGIIKLDTFDYKLFNKEKVCQLVGLLYLKNEKTIEKEEKQASVDFIKRDNEELTKRISDIEINVDKILKDRKECKLFIETTVDNAIKTGTKVINEVEKNLKGASEVASIVGKDFLKKAKKKVNNFLSDLVDDGYVEEVVIETREENALTEIKNIPTEEDNIGEFKFDVRNDVKKLLKKLDENKNSKK